MSVRKDFDDYLTKSFKSGKEFYDTESRNVYRGIDVKKIPFVVSEKNLDYEKFIVERCQIDCHNRIGYRDFYDYFEEYKKETEPNFKMTKQYLSEIKNYLDSKFLPGRVYISNQDASTGLRGVLGLGHKNNNFGLKEKKRNNHQVGEYDAKTLQLLRRFDSILLGSRELEIPYSSLQNIISSGKLLNDKVYKILNIKK
jgi:hypothetical protein